MSWGDGDTTDWQPPVAAGDTLALDRRYNPGSHNVRCQALDSRSALSRWSDPAPLAVADGPPFPDSVIAQLRGFFDEECQALASPDNSVFYVTSDAWLFVIDAATGAFRDSLWLPGCAGVAADWSAGRLFVTAGRRLYSVSIANLQATDSVDIPDTWLTDVCVSPSDNVVYVCNSSSPRGNVYAFSADSLDYIDEARLHASPHQLELSPDGRYVYAASDEGPVYVIDARSSLTVVDSLADCVGASDMVLDRTGQRLYVAQVDAYITCLVLRTSDGACLGELWHYGAAVGLSADGEYLYHCGVDAAVYRTSDLGLEKALPMPQGCGEGVRVAATPDGSRVLVLCSGCTPNSWLFGRRGQ